MTKTKTNAIQSRRLAFAEHIAAGKTGVESARLAGFRGNDNGLHVTASRLLRDATVQAMVEQARKASTTERIATAAQLKEFWTRIMRGEETSTVLIQGAAIEVQPSIADRIKAAELLGKTQGLFVDRTKQEGELQITIRRGADAPAALQPSKDK